jgi:hypothetical protein
MGLFKKHHLINLHISSPLNFDTDIIKIFGIDIFAIFQCLKSRARYVQRTVNVILQTLRTFSHLQHGSLRPSNVPERLYERV